MFDFVHIFNTFAIKSTMLVIVAKFIYPSSINCIVIVFCFTVTTGCALTIFHNIALMFYIFVISTLSSCFVFYFCICVSYFSIISFIFVCAPASPLFVLAFVLFPSCFAPTLSLAAATSWFQSPSTVW